MLRVGLTGDLGSGKSTVARLLAARGAVVLSSDEMGRTMMQPGEAVYAAIVARFGAKIVAGDGTLDRKALARLAFAEGRVAELNAIVHPAVIAEQARLIAELAKVQPEAVVVVESALIFSAMPVNESGDAWRKRFDRIVLVTAPQDAKVARFVQRVSGGRSLSGEERVAPEAEALRRLAAQGVAEAHQQECIVLRNDDDVGVLAAKVDVLWSQLSQAEPENNQNR